MKWRLLALASMAVPLLAFVITVAILSSGDDELDDELKEGLQSLAVSDLPIMALPLDELGADFSSMEVFYSGFQDNGSAAEDTPNPDDSGDDLREQGRITGYVVLYSHPSGSAPGVFEGDLYVQTSVELFQDPTGAAVGLTRRVDEWVRSEGQERDSGTGTRVVEAFRASGLGDDAEGVRSEWDLGDRVLYQTSVGFTLDRLAGWVMISAVDEADVGGHAEEIASALKRRMEEVARGEITGTPVPPHATDGAEPEDDEALGPGHTLGLRCSYASKFLREKHDLAPGRGCVVLRVSSPGAAERAGFQIGDKIVRMEDTPITSGRQFSLFFEGLPVSPSLQFAVQRRDQELTLDVELADRAEMPDEDPYFYYLRAKADTELRNYEQVIADYTKAIEMEPEFDLAYLYRGIANMGRDDEGARADVLRALELDPDLTEAYRALAQMAEQQGDLSEAISQIDRSIELNLCGDQVEVWDLDCAEDLVNRMAYYFDRLEPGDDLIIGTDVDAIQDVVLFEPALAYARFRLAYLRGDDGAAREFGEKFLEIPLDPLTEYLRRARVEVQRMLEADAYVLQYALSNWPTGRLVEAKNYRPQLESPEGTVIRSGPEPKVLVLFEIRKPDRFRGETVSWELWSGSYRLLGSEALRAWGEDWLVKFELLEAPAPGQYELRLCVDGEPVGVTQMNLP